MATKRQREARERQMQRHRRNQAILRAYSAGERSSVLSEQYGICENRVRQIVGEAGIIRLRGRPRIPEQAQADRYQWRKMRECLGDEAARAHFEGLA